MNMLDIAATLAKLRLTTAVEDERRCGIGLSISVARLEYLDKWATELVSAVNDRLEFDRAGGIPLATDPLRNAKF